MIPVGRFISHVETLVATDDLPAVGARVHDIFATINTEGNQTAAQKAEQHESAKREEIGGSMYQCKCPIPRISESRSRNREF